FNPRVNFSSSFMRNTSQSPHPFLQLVPPDATFPATTPAPGVAEIAPCRSRNPKSPLSRRKKRPATRTTPPPHDTSAEGSTLLYALTRSFRHASDPRADTN